MLITDVSGYNINVPYAFTGINGWSTVSKAYYKNEQGMVMFLTAMTGGTSANGTIVGTLTAGARPSETLARVAAMDASGVFGYVSIPGSNGVITIGTIASNGGMFIQPFQGLTDIV